MAWKGHGSPLEVSFLHVTVHVGVLTTPGGRNMCPGRFLAKGIITYTMAVLANEFDVELLVGSVNLGNDRFGIGVELPTHKVPFRIKKRDPHLGL